MLSSRPFQHLHNAHSTAKTPGRENAAAHRGLGGAPMTVNGKARQGAAGYAQPSKSTNELTKTAPRLLTHKLPLGDKTPFTNQVADKRFVTPLPGAEKIAKLNLGLALLENTTSMPQPQLGATPDSVLRPSSTRRHSRTPRISAGALVGQTSFITPMNNGRHWDVSEGDIAVGETELAVEAEPEGEKDDYDEIEYMPPKVDIPYAPPLNFDLPNYAEAGKALLERMRSTPISYDDEGPLPDIEIPVESLHCAFELPLPEMNLGFEVDLGLDDPFVEKAKGRSKMPARAVASTATSRAPSSAAATRPIRAATASSRPGTRAAAPSTRPAAALRKPVVSTVPTKRPIGNAVTTTNVARSVKTTNLAAARTTATAGNRPATAAARAVQSARPGHSRTKSASAVPVTRPTQNSRLQLVPAADDFDALVVGDVAAFGEDDFLFDV
ncbi:hypothetical protein MKEN_01215500 [Mycena kentingensis (nom. inval.)]|nr:hypothetical protein MKEN_01215500 [Mycena kentingensis (nom. inval.)]